MGTKKDTEIPIADYSDVVIIPSSIEIEDIIGC